MLTATLNPALRSIARMSPRNGWQSGCTIILAALGPSWHLLVQLLPSYFPSSRPIKQYTQTTNKIPFGGDDACDSFKCSNPKSHVMMHVPLI
uniref:Uncharacterized protein n=1 Tax=Salix viminalis TaxID=40686 RepID=A0A6N2K0F3_SALVM